MTLGAMKRIGDFIGRLRALPEETRRIIAVGLMATIVIAAIANTGSFFGGNLAAITGPAGDGASIGEPAVAPVVEVVSPAKGMLETFHDAFSSIGSFVAWLGSKASSFSFGAAAAAVQSFFAGIWTAAGDAFGGAASALSKFLYETIVK